METKQKVGKYTVQVQYSEYPVDSPRDWDNAWKFMFAHKRYYMPNETDLSFDDYSSWKELETDLKKQYLHIVPVWMFDHSGLSFGIGDKPCPWDSGQVGFALLSKEDINNFGLEDFSYDKLVDLLIEDLEVFGQYMNGTSYEYQILDEHGNVIDSCTGYYKLEYAMESGVADAKSLIKYEEQKAWEKFMDGVSAGLN